MEKNVFLVISYICQYLDIFNLIHFLVLFLCIILHSLSLNLAITEDMTLKSGSKLMLVVSFSFYLCRDKRCSFDINLKSNKMFVIDISRLCHAIKCVINYFWIWKEDLIRVSLVLGHINHCWLSKPFYFKQFSLA